MNSVRSIHTLASDKSKMCFCVAYFIVLYSSPTGDKVPFIADLKPSGKYAMEDLHRVGGVTAVLKLLLREGFINGADSVSSNLFVIVLIEC